MRQRGSGNGRRARFSAPGKNKRDFRTEYPVEVRHGRWILIGPWPRHASHVVSLTGEVAPGEGGSCPVLSLSGLALWGRLAAATRVAASHAVSGGALPASRRGHEKDPESPRVGGGRLRGAFCEGSLSADVVRTVDGTAGWWSWCKPPEKKQKSRRALPLISTCMRPFLIYARRGFRVRKP